MTKKLERFVDDDEDCERTDKLNALVAAVTGLQEWAALQPGRPVQLNCGPGIVPPKPNLCDTCADRDCADMPTIRGTAITRCEKFTPKQDEPKEAWLMVEVSRVDDFVFITFKDAYGREVVHRVNPDDLRTDEPRNGKLSEVERADLDFLATVVSERDALRTEIEKAKELLREGSCLFYTLTPQSIQNRIKEFLDADKG